MRVDFLGAARVIDNFIGGVMEPYSYEDYLRDFVNCSSYFLKKSNGKLYKKPESEAHGEYDCASDEYKLDFKLFASQSRLQAAKNSFTINPRNHARCYKLWAIRKA